MPSDPTVDLRRTFDRAAERYAAVRPGYPPAFFATLFELLPTEPYVIEVGPGTGQATVDLLRHGARVTAVELGPRLAAVLENRLGCARLEIVVGDFEEIPPPGGFDAVVSASAYHWIPFPARIDRPAELLVPGGLLAEISLTQVDAPEDGGFYDRAQPIFDRHGEGRAHAVKPPAPDGVRPPLVEQLDADDRFERVIHEQVRWDQTYPVDAFADLMRTFSPMLALPTERREALIGDLGDFVRAEYGGSVTRPLVASLVIGRRV